MTEQEAVAAGWVYKWWDDGFRGCYVWYKPDGTFFGLRLPRKD